MTPTPAKPHNRLQVLISIVLAMLVASMDTTIINTTMPIIVKDLGGYRLYAWAFASYMIFATVLTPIAGRISDLYGRKTILASGIIVFLSGSLLCGLAQSMLQLILFRAVQGIGAGIMNPFPAIIAGDLYPIEERGKIQALFSAMWGISAVIAPLFGAMFTEYATWRWIFYINIPICLLSLFFLRAYKEEYEPKPAAVDYGGAALFTVGVSLTLAATAFKEQAVWLLISGIAVLALFVRFERKQVSPIVPLSLFGNRPVRRMNINAFLSNAALFGTASFAPTFLQEQGYSTFVSGVALLAQSTGWMLMSVPAGKLILRYGYSRLLILGKHLARSVRSSTVLPCWEQQLYLHADRLVHSGAGLRSPRHGDDHRGPAIRRDRPPGNLHLAHDLLEEHRHRRRRHHYGEPPHRSRPVHDRHSPPVCIWVDHQRRLAGYRLPRAES